MATWLTADTHFGHANILRYCERPFPDVEAMNRGLAERWNAVVAPDDVVYHLGDFALGSRARWPSYVAALRGRIVLVRGNHDRRPAEMRALGFHEVLENVVVAIDGVRCWLNHLPAEPDYQGRPLIRPAAPGPYDVALCGHVHQRWTVHGGIVNVGVDRWGYRPIALADALAAT